MQSYINRTSAFDQAFIQRIRDKKEGSTAQDTDEFNNSNTQSAFAVSPCSVNKNKNTDGQDRICVSRFNDCAKSSNSNQSSVITKMTQANSQLKAGGKPSTSKKISLCTSKVKTNNKLSVKNCNKMKDIAGIID